MNTSAVVSSAHALKEWNTDRVEVRERPGTGECDGDPEHRSAAGQHDAFRQHLAQETTTARSERGANRHLLLPRRRSRQQQARQVRAHDQHDDANGTAEHDDRRPRPAADMRGKRHDIPLEAVAIGGMLTGDLLPEGSHFCRGALDRNARFHPRDHRERVPHAAGLGRERKRDEQVDVARRREH